MKLKNTDEWVQGIGLLGIIGSLIFVGLQLRQAEDVALSDLGESSITWGIELSSLIADHADVWQRACLGDELSPSEQVIAGNIFSRYMQSNFNSWVRLESTDVGHYDSSFLSGAFAANFHRYPGFRKMTESWGDWSKLGVPIDSPYVTNFGEEVLARVVELEKEEPNPTADVMWCGVR